MNIDKRIEVHEGTKIKFPFFSNFLQSYSQVMVGDSVLSSGNTRRKLYAKSHPNDLSNLLYPSGMGLDITDWSSRDIDTTHLSTYVFSILNIHRKIRYHLYDLIEEWHPEVSVALDMIADEACIRGLNNEVISLIVEKADGSVANDEEESDIAGITTVLKTCFFKELNISSKLWHWVRNMVKYGDWFIEPVLGERGVIDVKTIYDVDNVNRVDLLDATSYFVYTPQKSALDSTQNIGNDYNTSLIWQPAFVGNLSLANKSNIIVYMDGELIHFKLEGKPHYRPYGTSHLDCLRQTWEILKKMEDAMLVYRLVRAPERKVFKVFTGKLPHEKAVAFVRKMQMQYKRRASGGAFELTGGSFNNVDDLDKRFRTIALDEDFWMPVGEGGVGTSIDTLPGATNLSEIEDINYMHDKFIVGLRIAKSYLASNENVLRSTLVQQDVHFSRLVTRMQESMNDGLEKLALLHLYAFYSGMSGKVEDIRKVKDFLEKYRISFKWTTASFIEENARLEGLKIKGEAAQNLKAVLGDKAEKFIIKAIYQFTPEEEILLESEKEQEIAIDTTPPAEFGQLPAGGTAGPPLPETAAPEAPPAEEAPPVEIKPAAETSAETSAEKPPETTAPKEQIRLDSITDLFKEHLYMGRATSSGISNNIDRNRMMVMLETKFGLKVKDDSKLLKECQLMQENLFEKVAITLDVALKSNLLKEYNSSKKSLNGSEEEFVPEPPEDLINSDGERNEN